MQVICLQLNIFYFFKLEKKTSGLLDLNNVIIITIRLTV